MVMVREKLEKKMGWIPFPYPRSFRPASRTIIKFVPEKWVAPSDWIFLPVFLFLIVMPNSGLADVTLEIMDLTFPKDCGAFYTDDISTRSQCHLPEVTPESFQILADSTTEYHWANRKVVNLEEEASIIFLVPEQRLKSDQPFARAIVINGHAIMYQYGYRKNGDPFMILKSQWLPGSPNVKFSHYHNGTSLLLIHQPEEYVCIVELLHNQDHISEGGYRWAEVVFLWTLTVNE
jgi:hypothetical protein